MIQIWNEDLCRLLTENQMCGGRLQYTTQLLLTKLTNNISKWSLFLIFWWTQIWALPSCTGDVIQSFPPPRREQSSGLTWHDSAHTSFYTLKHKQPSAWTRGKSTFLTGGRVIFEVKTLDLNLTPSLPHWLISVQNHFSWNIFWSDSRYLTTVDTQQNKTWICKFIRHSIRLVCLMNGWNH